MDIAVKKTKRKSIQRALIAFAIIVPVAFAANYLRYLSQADYSVERESLVIGEVKQGDFLVSVRGTGEFVPDNIQFLSADVEATVTAVVKKAGNVVTEGEIVVKLSNPVLVQRLSEAKWDFDAMKATTRSDRVAQESRINEQESSVLNAKLEYEKAMSEFEARTELIEYNAVSKLDYKRSRVEMNQAKQRWRASESTLEKMRENLVAQNIAREAQLKKAENIYEHYRRQVDNLDVRAGMDSIILDVPVEVGQRILAGASIAKLAQQDSLIAEIRVPEIQIGSVEVGQRVVIDTRNSTAEGTVSRIDPAVVNGNVQVDVVFDSGLPSGARPDLSVDGEIMVRDIPDTLFVSRPLFAQSKMKSMFFKLSEDENFAERVPVQLGYGATSNIEVLAGLNAGDKIITSDPTRFESYRKIRIQ